MGSGSLLWGMNNKINITSHFAHTHHRFSSMQSNSECNTPTLTMHSTDTLAHRELTMP